MNTYKISIALRRQKLLNNCEVLEKLDSLKIILYLFLSLIIKNKDLYIGFCYCLGKRTAFDLQSSHIGF